MSSSNVNPSRLRWFFYPLYDPIFQGIARVHMCSYIMIHDNDRRWIVKFLIEDASQLLTRVSFWKERTPMRVADLIMAAGRSSDWNIGPGLIMTRRNFRIADREQRGDVCWEESQEVGCGKEAEGKTEEEVDGLCERRHENCRGDRRGCAG